MIKKILVETLSVAIFMSSVVLIFVACIDTTPVDPNCPIKHMQGAEFWQDGNGEPRSCLECHVKGVRK